MTRKDHHSATRERKTLPAALRGTFGGALIAGAAALLAVPSAGLAVVGLSSDRAYSNDPSAFDFFTPASVDPELAARVAEKARKRGIRFTPVGASITDADRTVTVAVRVDQDAAQSFSIGDTTEVTPGLGTGIVGLQASRFNLGTALGYQSFARAQNEDTTPVSGRPIVLDGVSSLSIPDLAEFEPSRPSRSDRPSRLQPRIELGDEAILGRSANTLDSIGSQTVDVGGAFSLSPNLDVTAGVRYSQERERLDPLTNSVQDSQAVYVGTQIRF
ncbi:MAG: hypothetical protein AAF697_04235 [Pseudomonadota bacterium]